jgi:drug/metabolite transporter (DMT)-like permease
MDRPLQGVALQLAALMLFVLMDTLFKLLSGFHAGQLAWARFTFSALAVVIALRVTAGRLPWRTRAPGLQVLRSLLLLGCTLSFAEALAHIPIADATAVGFASPIITVALAALLLREAVGWRRWLGVVVGLVGVMIAVRPPFLTGQPLHWAYLLPLATAIMFAFYQIITRRLAQVDDPRVTILHTSLLGTLIGFAMLPFVYIPPMPLEWAGLVAIGLLGAFSHGLLVLAHQRAPASLLAPLSYTQLIWAGLAGILLFSDWPDAITLLGAAIIAAGGFLIMAPEKRRAATG